MKRFLSTLVFVVIVGGCAGSAATRATNALAIKCSTWAAALEELAPRRAAGKLSKENVKRVESTKKIIDPICLPGSIVDPAQGVKIVEQGIELLKTVNR